MRAAHRQRRRSARPGQVTHLGKPRGILSPRVQAVGPEHFGIVAVDPAKARSTWMFADFYGRILIPPRVVEHRRDAFDEALALLRDTIAQQDIRDLIVAVERTGRYHLPVLRAFAAAGYETRIVHPNISCHFRQAGSYDTKTDAIDLEAGIFRAAVNGFGLHEPPWDGLYTALQLWVRHRRDLVQKATLLCCQILEHLEAFLPGYARCFDNVFISKIALLVPTRYPSPHAVAQAGLEGLTQLARLARVQVQTPTLLRILGWAQNAPAPGPDAALHQRCFLALHQDRITKEKQIHAAERELVSHLVQTPYVRLLALVGINVVLASELAAEAGPMEHYATARVITGRAGLYPRRYQSDAVDYDSGGLARRGNRRLRQALLLGADTLIRCNDHFRMLAAKWSDQGTDHRAIHVRVAGRYARIAFQMVTGTGAFRHPACQGDPAVLSKLIEFHNVHEINIETTQVNLRRAAEKLPGAEQQREWARLAACQEETCRRRQGRKVRQLNATLSAVLGPVRGDAAAARGAPSSEATSSGEVETSFIKYEHPIDHSNENIIVTKKELGPTAAPLPPAPPAWKPAAPEAQGPARRSHRGRGPQPLSAILPVVLQKLGVEPAAMIQSTPSGETP
jgi:transposase